jgi:hypothetical protein
MGPVACPQQAWLNKAITAAAETGKWAKVIEASGAKP